MIHRANHFALLFVGHFKSRAMTERATLSLDQVTNQNQSCNISHVTERDRMRWIILVIIVTSLSLVAAARSVHCEVQKNSQMIGEKDVQTTLQEKQLIFKDDLITAYLSEKSNERFLVEAFVPDYEIRFYGEGVLKSKDDQVIASLWGRDYLIEISCR